MEDDEFLEEDEVFTYTSQEQSEEYKEEIKAILDTFTPDQMARYEAYRRAGLSKPTIKKFLQSAVGAPIQASTVIVVAGAAKVFIGEITESALTIARSQDHTGPLQPSHIREAFRMYKSVREKSHSHRRLFS
jgi:transcription initiation factor TFIID subunit 11